MSHNSGKLYVVATPIGNLGDISARATAILREVDVVLCEDTRVSGKLLSALAIRKPMMSYHEHSDARRTHEVVTEMLEGKTMALVTDAGTPGVNDPGGVLVAAAAKVGIDIIPVPGPNATVTALSICGFPADRYTFVGFPPNKKGRETFFRELGGVEHTLVMFESTHRIVKTLEQLKQLNRPVVVCRELTKLHETIYRGSVQDVLDRLEQTSTKGEFVIVVAPKDWK
ncbi:MAG: Ribosomal RNA small subunit methyltransferase I [Candidatus Uhrbacteria bacterium GW2011_GWD2_52_7]|uniref:Ribosomal RNA small subunit methyltransferase I n=1 Tax=Candidatus Uhrbacteria bacterium GW2011_GWD2_52_7 TaxID=1618989 RepID=A0A0G1ZQE5_9BACT|nr:MAG: Ribosomal RNA small subunit methyltransferase I [Candidatus Uhrbacteria bacterium GW2011_GWD2_52_7]